MGYMPIVMDGITYHIRIEADTLEEAWRIEDGVNADQLISGKKVRDVVGTYYGHQMDVWADPEHPEDFEAFALAISAPVDHHTITMPHLAGTITYDAAVYSGTIKYRRTVNGVRKYAGMSVDFEPLAPQREAL